MVVSQFFAPLRTLKNKARGRVTSATTGWSDDDDQIDEDTSTKPDAGKEPESMTTGTCLCCGSKVSFPDSVACFKCTVCDTINDLSPLVRLDRVVENGQTVAKARTPPPPLTLERLRAGVHAFRKHPEKQALLEAMLRESFGSWDVLNFSFPSAAAAAPATAGDDPGIDMAEVHAAYKIILALPPQVIRAMMSGIEQVLRRPGRPLAQRSDVRYLLIIIENPLLLQQNFPQESSYHHHIVKSIVGSIANLPNRIHYTLVLWLSQHSRSSVRRKVQLVSQFISYRVQKYDRAKRRNPRPIPLTSYSSQSNQTELPAFQRTRSATNAPPSGRHMRMRSNTDSRISLSSHEKSAIERIVEPQIEPADIEPVPPVPPLPEAGRRTGLGIANLSIGHHARERVPTAPSNLHLRGAHLAHDDARAASSRGHRSRTLGAWAAAPGAARLAANSLTPPPPAHACDSPKLAPASGNAPRAHAGPVDAEAGDGGRVRVVEPAGPRSAGSLPPLMPLVAQPPLQESVLGVLDGTAEPSSPVASVRGRNSLTRTRSSSEAPLRRRLGASREPTNESRSPQLMGEWAGGVSVDDYYVGADGVFYPKTSSLVMHQHDWRLVAAAKFMALLHAANLLLPARTRLPVKDFYIEAIDNMDLIADYDAWQARIPGAFSFCQYPFLLTLRAKVQIMQVDAARQMDSKLKEAVISALFQNFHLGQHGQNQPHLKLLIRRRCLVEDSLHQLATREQDLKKRLKIEFVGEEGVDAGGLAKEWFMLLVRELMNPMHGMFVRESDADACWFNPASLESSNQYFLVGVVVGLALYNSTILDMHLPLPVFKKLLRTGLYQTATAPGVASALFVAKSSAEPSIVSANHYPTVSSGASTNASKDKTAYAPRYGPPTAGGGASSNDAGCGGGGDGRSPIYGLLSPSAQLRYQINEMLSDVSQFRPDLARGLRALLQYREDDVEDTFCLTFEVSYDAYGEITTVPLIPNGALVPVTSQNRVEYVMRYLQWILNDSIAKQFEPFKRGFYYVCGGNALSLFKPEEIELMVRGSGEDWDPRDLMALTEVVGFEEEEAAAVLEWFWDVLREMGPAERRLFLAFVTGSDRLPTVAANSQLRLKLVLLGVDSGRLPIAHTCFNQLGLWMYRSKDELRDKLVLALNESEGFGLK